MARYWYKQSQEAPAQGPCRASEIRRLAAAGVLTAHSLISTNESDWVPASYVKGLFATPTSGPEVEGNTELPAAAMSDSPLSPLAPPDTTPARRYPDTDYDSSDAHIEDLVSISAHAEADPFDTTLTGQQSQPLTSPYTARGGQRFTIGLALTQGWRTMINNYGSILGATLLAALLQMGMVLIVLVGWLASVVVSPVLFAGLIYMGVGAYRNQRIGVGDVLCGFRRFGSILGIAYLRLAVFVACHLPAGIAVLLGLVLERGFGTKTAITLILSAPITIVLVAAVMLRLVFAEHVCLDAGLGVLASLRRSWAMTRPVAGRLLIFLIMLSLIALATAVSCFLPYLFFGLPLLISCSGAAYNLISAPPSQTQVNGRVTSS